MRLAEFILSGMEKILVEWEAFARTLFPVKEQMSSTGLRDHAKQILQAIAADLGTEQTAAAQCAKSKDRVFQPTEAAATAAEIHAVLRAQSGMDINQLAAEYRALRASVLRLWGEASPLGGDDVDDIFRFNEAIDQALAESISHFSGQVDRSRDLLLGMLGHDMRNPLTAITLTGEILSGLDAGEEVSKAAQCLISSGEAIESLLNDLVDFSRRNLGLGITIALGPVDLEAICLSEVQLHQASHPTTCVAFKKEGDLHGTWDGDRMRQVIRNLLSNATAYGEAGKHVQLSVHGKLDHVGLEVGNTGPTIDPEQAQRIFDPLQRGDRSENQNNRKGLGLGLFIVREVCRAHGGEVEVQSGKGETRFLVRLPRHAGTPKAPDL